MVFPSASMTLPPKDQQMDQKVELASKQWLTAIPTGCPAFLSFFPAVRRSIQVSGGFSPTSLNFDMR
jgi:hypothetical protein